MNSENWGSWYVVAVIAAVVAVTECGAMIIAVNRPDVIAGFDLDPWVPVVVTIAAVLIAVVVAATVALAAVPRRHTISI